MPLARSRLSFAAFAAAICSTERSPPLERRAFEVVFAFFLAAICSGVRLLSPLSVPASIFSICNFARELCSLQQFNSPILSVATYQLHEGIVFLRIYM
jgi:hypothetical protein